MLKAEAVRLANEEGLTLEPADTAGGYKGVMKDKRAKSRPYQARIRQGGKPKTLGCFDRGGGGTRVRSTRTAHQDCFVARTDALIAEDPDACPICLNPPDDVGWKCTQCVYVQCSACHEQWASFCATQGRAAFCPYCKLGFEEPIPDHSAMVGGVHG